MGTGSQEWRLGGGVGWRKAGILVSLLVAALSDPDVGWSVNGLNLIGSGGLSSGLAGADTAIALDFTTINTNPAGMAYVGDSWAAGASFGLLQTRLRFQNAVNDREGQGHPLYIPNAGYLHHLPNTPITLGIGFFTIGGTATDYRDIRGPFGTTDRIGSQIRHYKLTPSIAYQVTKDLSLGATLALSYADISLAITPNSPGAPGTPLGFQTSGSCDRHNGLAPPTGNCPYALGLTPKFGLMYRVNDRVTVGLTYTMATSLPLRHGRATQNLGLIGQGVAAYDFKGTGLKWADDLALGLSVRPTDRLLLAFKFQWINWSGSLNNVVIDLTNGNNPAVPASRFELPFNWRDQFVTAIAAAYDVTETVTVHGGYNFGNDPTRKTSLDPTTANITEHHFVGGLLYKVTPRWYVDGLVNYTASNTVTYDSALWGASTTSKAGGYEVVLSLGYKM